MSKKPTFYNRKFQQSKDAAISFANLLIGLLGTILIGIEGVEIFHDKLPRPKQAKLGPQLIPVLGCDLVEVDRKLSKGELSTRCKYRGDYLFVGGRQTVLRLVPISDSKHLFTRILPPFGSYPQVFTNHRWHYQFLCTHSVHFSIHQSD